MNNFSDSIKAKLDEIVKLIIDREKEGAELTLKTFQEDSILPEDETMTFERFEIHEKIQAIHNDVRIARDHLEIAMRKVSFGCMEASKKVLESIPENLKERIMKKVGKDGRDVIKKADECLKILNKGKK